MRHVTTNTRVTKLQITIIIFIDTHQWVFEDFWIFVMRWWIDGESVTSSDEELLSTFRHKVRVLVDVANHEDATR